MNGGRDWYMKKMCADCPFAMRGPGRRLRISLGLARWRQILGDLRRDKHFICHKTSEETGDGSNKHCAGSILWQIKHNGQPSQMARICERIYGEEVRCS